MGGAEIHDADRAVAGSEAHQRVKPADAGMLQLHVRRLVPVAYPEKVRRDEAFASNTTSHEACVPAKERARLDQSQCLDDSLVLDALQDSAWDWGSGPRRWRTPLIRRGRRWLLSLFGGRLRCLLWQGVPRISGYREPDAVTGRAEWGLESERGPAPFWTARC